MPTLTQKKFLQPTLDFQLDGNQLKVIRKHMLSRSSFEVNVEELRKDRVEHKNFAIGALSASILLTLLGIILIITAYTGTDDIRAFQLYVFAFSSLLIGVCIFGHYWQSTFDYVTWVYKDSEAPAVTFYRDIPNPSEYQDFTNELVHRIVGDRNSPGFAGLNKENKSQ